MKDSTIAQFNAEMIEGGENITIVVFYSSWLPVRATEELLATFDAISSRFQGVKFLQYSVNNQTHLPQSLGIKGIPTIYGFKGNEYVDMKVGFMPPERMVEFIDRVINGITNDNSEY